MALPVLTVRQVMQSEPVTVDPDCPLDVVLGLMNLQRIGAVIVVDPERSPLGIFSERDLMRRVAVAAPAQASDAPEGARLRRPEPMPEAAAPSVRVEEA